MSEKVKCVGEKVLKGGKALESNKNGQPSVWSGKGMKPPPGADTAQVHGLSLEPQAAAQPGCSQGTEPRTGNEVAETAATSGRSIPDGGHTVS